ncbi:MAG: 4'-phosphopantetheinyl transferase superfamily protein [Balneolia bacterium]|nr:4'-phosphopantetheinyl transferase superfamily protein [Balneolia bacterium]
MAIIFSYRPEGENNPLVYIAGGFETDSDHYRQTLLSEVLKAAGLDSSGIEVFRLESGKPCVRSADESYSFSVSHSKGFLAVALAVKGEAGLDTEVADRVVQPSLIKRIMSTDESEFENSIAPLTLWTLKEAFLKMTGKGLRHAMNKVNVKPSQPHLYKAESVIEGKRIKADLVSFLYRKHRITLAWSAERILHAE